MNELCDGVIAVPGGFGTIEELFEMLTWGQLGLHKKPIGILNINGFYDNLIAFLDDMVTKGLLKEINRNMVLISENIDELIIKMKAYNNPFERALLESTVQKKNLHQQLMLYQKICARFYKLPKSIGNYDETSKTHRNQ